MPFHLQVAILPVEVSQFAQLAREQIRNGTHPSDYPYEKLYNYFLWIKSLPHQETKLNSMKEFLEVEQLLVLGKKTQLSDLVRQEIEKMEEIEEIDFTCYETLEN